MKPTIDLAAWLSAWRGTWRLLGAEASVPELTAVLNAWAEPHRHYHDLTHLRECLGRWAEWQHLAEQPGEVALALWYHDAIYNPRSTDNELRSAAWAARAMTEAGTDVGSVQRVHDLVMANCHNAPAATRDAELVVDIDLATLGAEAERFETYDRDVRKEYAWVPGFLYRRKRREVLRAFLDRPRIYATDLAHAELEAPARRNLAAALSRLAQ
jgi:predicted metal-dependent HD superfamily phosphohydrolase